MFAGVLEPNDVVTTTGALVAVPAGVTAEIVVELTTVTCCAAAPPTVTCGVPVKLVPVMVMRVRP